MPLDENLQKDLIEGIKQTPWTTSDSELHFVHIFRREAFPYMMPPMVYPSKEQEGEITANLTKAFEGITKELTLNKQFSILYHDSPKEGALEFLNAHAFDLAIGHTRKKHGVADYFSSSFTEYLVSHAPCHVLVLRNFAK